MDYDAASDLLFLKKIIQEMVKEIRNGKDYNIEYITNTAMAIAFIEMALYYMRQP